MNLYTEWLSRNRVNLHANPLILSPPRKKKKKKKKTKQRNKSPGSLTKSKKLCKTGRNSLRCLILLRERLAETSSNREFIRAPGLSPLRPFLGASRSGLSFEEKKEKKKEKEYVRVPATDEKSIRYSFVVAETWKITRGSTRRPRGTYSSTCRIRSTLICWWKGWPPIGNGSRSWSPRTWASRSSRISPIPGATLNSQLTRTLTARLSLWWGCRTRTNSRLHRSPEACWTVFSTAPD